MDENDKYKSSLEAFRAQIDAFDEQIISLLHQRSQVVANVGKLKAEYNQQGSYIRPARESIMLKDLIVKSDGLFPREGIASIWRTIIGASTAMESPLNLTIFAKEKGYLYYLAREYFGTFLPYRMVGAASGLHQAMKDDPHTIGIVPCKASDAWWQGLLPECNVFACLPVVMEEFVEALAIGQVEVLPTGDDITLIAVTDLNETGDALKAFCNGIDLAEVWRTETPNSILLAVEGFHGTDSDTFQQLAKRAKEHVYEVSWLGAYGAPIKSL